MTEDQDKLAMAGNGQSTEKLYTMRTRITDSLLALIVGLFFGSLFTIAYYTGTRPGKLTDAYREGITIGVRQADENIRKLQDEIEIWKLKADENLERASEMEKVFNDLAKMTSKAVKNIQEYKAEHEAKGCVFPTQSDDGSI